MSTKLNINAINNKSIPLSKLSEDVNNVYVLPFTAQNLMDSVDDEGGVIQIEGYVDEIDEAIKANKTFTVRQDSYNMWNVVFLEFTKQSTYYRFICIVDQKIVKGEITIDGNFAETMSCVDFTPINIQDEITGKQNFITDLDAIRSGASMGATSIQPDDITDFVTADDLAQVATSGSYNDLTDKPTIPSGNGTYITPFTWEDLYYGMINGAPVQCDMFNLMDAMQARKTILVPISNDYPGTFVLNGYYEDLLYFSITNDVGNVITCVGTPYNNVDFIEGQELQFHEWGKKQDALVSGTNIKTVNGQSLLGSGDLTINVGSNVTEDTVSDWGFTKNVGTITGVAINGTIMASSGTAYLPNASTSVYGLTKLSSSTSSTSTILAATASAVKSAYDLAYSKQDKLTSGTNIKTINNQSILGSGDITIGAYAEVSHGTSDTTFTLTPNTFHVWDEVASLDLDFGEETSGVANEYLFQFTSGATPTTLTLPDDIKWANDTAPIIAENMIYQVSILKGLGSVLEFPSSAELIENKATITNASTGEVTFQYPVASEIAVYMRGDMPVSLTFNKGEQTKNYDELIIEEYTITGIKPSQDNVYYYTY